VTHRVFDATLGLDFGSSKLSVAVFRAQFPEVIRNELANRTTPAVIVFGSGNRLVGEPAELVKTRGGAITNVKELVVSGVAPPPVNFKGDSVQLRPEHAAAMLVARVAGDVSRYATSSNLKAVPNKTVLAVPQSLSAAHVKALVTAATLGGLQVTGTVFDVTCASLVFAHRAAAAGEKEAQNVVFFDVGHEFSSAQVVHVDPANSAIKILATQSKAGVGASSFSRVLVDLWTKLLLSKHKIELAKLKPELRDRAVMRLNAQADKAKNMLSGLPDVDVVVDSVTPDLDLRTKVTRAEMEAGAAHVTEELGKLLRDVVAAAGLQVEDVKRVEVVGGGSRVPCVQQLVKSIFGPASLFKTLDNECTAATGAALYAGLLEGSLSFSVSGAPAGPEPEFKDAPGLSEEELGKIRALEQLMHENDLAVTAKNDAKNVLEKFVFDTRREASENTVGVDDEDTLDKLRSLLSSAENWIYEEGEAADAAGVTAKLESVRKEAEAVAPKLFEVLRKKDEKAREERIASMQEVIAPTEKKKKAHLRPSEKIADALAKKEHGNTLIRDNNFEDATKRYTQALGICAEMDGTLAPDDQAKVNEIKLSCYLNLSMANVKLKSAKLGVYNATKAVELAPDKPKGYFRRAQARYETKDFEEAKQDLVICLKKDPNDEAAKKLLAKTEQCISVQTAKQKKAYANMFRSTPDDKGEKKEEEKKEEDQK
jgi:molecular chaperone DnaK (HSP70)